MKRERLLGHLKPDEVRDADEDLAGRSRKDAPIERRRADNSPEECEDVGALGLENGSVRVDQQELIALGDAKFVAPCGQHLTVVPLVGAEAVD